jgi:hypothetical protein
MRWFFSLGILLAVVLTAGCISGDNTPAPPATTVATTKVTVATPTPEPVPVEMAYLEKMDCSVVEEKVTTYRCIGKVRIKGGGPRDVTVMVKYPDNNSFDSGTLSMGGSDPVMKPFYLFPDLRYRNENASYFVKIDKTLYPVVMQNGTAIAYENPPPAPAVTPTVFVQNRMVSVPGPTTKTTVTTPMTTSSVRTTATPHTQGTPLYWAPAIVEFTPASGGKETRLFSIRGTDFRQDVPPKIYLRRQDATCELCGVQATGVTVLSPTDLVCVFDLSGEAGGPASYDVLITNSNLEDAYNTLRNGFMLH